MFKIVTLVWYHPRSLLRQVVTKIHTHTHAQLVYLCVFTIIFGFLSCLGLLAIMAHTLSLSIFPTSDGYKNTISRVFTHSIQLEIFWQKICLFHLSLPSEQISHIEKHHLPGIAQTNYMNKKKKELPYFFVGRRYMCPCAQYYICISKSFHIVLTHSTSHVSKLVSLSACLSSSTSVCAYEREKEWVSV